VIDADLAESLEACCLRRRALASLVLVPLIPTGLCQPGHTAGRRRRSYCMQPIAVFGTCEAGCLT